MKREYVYKNKIKTLVVRFFDAVGYFFFPPLKKIEMSSQNILVVRLDQLGDIVQTFPFLESLRKKYPASKLTFLTTPLGKKLLTGTKLIDDFYEWEAPWFGRYSSHRPSLWKVLKWLRGQRFDCAFDLRGDVRVMALLGIAGIKNRIGTGGTGGGFLLSACVPWNSHQHRVDFNLEFIKAINAPVVTSIPMFSGTNNERKKITSKVKLAVHPDAGVEAKKWPVEKFSRVIQESLNNNYDVVLVGSDKGLGEAIEQRFSGRIVNKMGKTTLEELKSELDACDGLLSNDSGPAHMMGALNKPVWVVWSGTADQRLWSPRGPYVKIFSHPVACSPCSLNKCPVPGHPCLSEINEDEVFYSIYNFFKSGESA